MWGEYLTSVANGDDQEYRLSFMNPIGPNFDGVMARLWFNYVLKAFEKYRRELAVGVANTTIDETANDDDDDDENDTPAGVDGSMIYVGDGAASR
jgi:hypothetical protein